MGTRLAYCIYRHMNLRCTSVTTMLLPLSQSTAVYVVPIYD